MGRRGTGGRISAGCGCSRRSFLRGAGLTLAGFGIHSVLPGPLLGRALAGTPANGRRLIFIFQRGGNDGVNMVIPHGDPDYSPASRQDLYIDPAASLPLNGFAHLHPAMADLMDAWNAGEVAFVHRVGFPGNSRSHFDDMRVWENGDPTQPKSQQGWLYRYIRENAVAAGARLPALSVQPIRPVILRGDEPHVNIASPDTFDHLYGDPLRTKLQASALDQYTNLAGLEPFRSVLRETEIKLVDTLDEYRTWDQAGWDPRDPDDPSLSLFPVDDATNPPDPNGPGGRRFRAVSYPFFQSLKVCALAMLESPAGSPNGTRVAGTELEGHDTHADQGGVTGAQSELLEWLAYGVRSLRIVLSGAAVDSRSYAPVWQETAVVTLSEFGRTTLMNGSLGSDHGAATAILVAGGTVAGGVVNCDAGSWPAGVLFGDSGRYLQMATDYRAVFWEILRDHMGADPATADAVFPGYTALGLQEPGLFV